MAEPRQMTVDLASSKRTIDTAIRIGLLALVVYWCLHIFKPFLIPVLWAIIIAVAIRPLYVKFESLLGGKQKLALSLFTIIALAILIIPSVLLASSMVDTVQHIAKRLAEGTLRSLRRRIAWRVGRSWVQGCMPSGVPPRKISWPRSSSLGPSSRWRGYGCCRQQQAWVRACCSSSWPS